ncbi:MAG: 6-bladed beta-propeller [Longimicrobiales bacterium]
MKAAQFLSNLSLTIVLASCVGDAPGSRNDLTTPNPLRLSGEPVCPECRIVLSQVASLGHPSDPASVQSDAAVAGCMVAAASDGTFLLGGVVGGGEIFVYGRDGQVASSIGQEGAGPGEFGSDLRLMTAGDTVIVVDNSNARIVTTDLNGAVLESFQLPIRVNSFARLATGHYLLHGRPSIGPDQPLFRLLDGTGTEISKFGRSTRDAWDTDQWVVSPGKSAHFWAASMWEYRLFRGWNDTLATAVIRDVDWFPSENVWSPEILETEPPPPLIMYLHETDDRLLWVFVALADSDWAPGIPDAGSAQWFKDSFDTMIEVIDLDGGRVLASHRSDDYLGGVCGTKLVYAVTPEHTGHVMVSVFEPHLER